MDVGKTFALALKLENAHKHAGARAPVDQWYRARACDQRDMF